VIDMTTTAYEVVPDMPEQAKQRLSELAAVGVKLRDGFNDWQRTEPISGVIPIQATTFVDYEPVWVWVSAFNVSVRIDMNEEGRPRFQVYVNGRYRTVSTDPEQVLSIMRRYIDRALGG